jgi:signal transduction histidine kinase
MARVTNLLNKPLKAFLIYALLILAASVPIYYYVVDYIWQQELDEHNLIIKREISNNLHQLKEVNISDNLDLLNLLQPSIKLEKVSKEDFHRDSVYTQLFETENQKERFRILKSVLVVNNQFYLLIVQTNIEEADETLMALTLVSVIFFTLLLIGFIYLNKKITAKVWQPFYQTLEQLKGFDLLNQKSIHLNKTNVVEFNDLNSELEKLIEKNIDSFKQQKFFLENASHELQTPLAIIKSKIDIELQNPDLNANQLLFINQINSCLSRASRINKNFLLLSKIENQQFSKVEGINVKDVIEENLEFLDDYIHDKNLTIIKNINIEILVNCNLTLLETLFNNLLINAIKHSLNKDTIKVILTEQHLIISNSGLNKLNQERIFNRYLTSENHSFNSGLGLAIAKEICKQYHWNIEYSFDGNFHVFTLTF